MSALAVQAPTRRLVVDGRSVTVVRGPIVSGEGGVSVHGALSGRDAADSHPLAAVTGLGDALDGKAAASHSHSGADITSGIVPPAVLGTGAANATTFLRGDGSWAAPAAGDSGYSRSFLLGGM